MAYNGMFVPADQDPRQEDHPVGELATYRSYLSFFRRTLEVKCRDLTPEQLAIRSVPPSTMSLLGMVRHLAAVEQNWLVRCLQGRPEEPRLYDKLTANDNDFDLAVGTQECVDEAWQAFHRWVAAFDAHLDDLPESELGATRTAPRGDDTVTVREVLVHLIEEYARHMGHADLLRETIDGRTGL